MGTTDTFQPANIAATHAHADHTEGLLRLLTA
jgi:glyoxylase-like metal-dependent hydrolase (beta-lactamase superfamily II)